MNNILQDTGTILSGLQKLCQLRRKDTLTLFVLNPDNKVLGSVTDGDLRRYLAGGGSLGDSITKAMKRDFIYVQNEIELFERSQEFRKLQIHLVPLVDNQMKLIRVYDMLHVRTRLPIDAIIMAGGRGERLRPLTDAVPKPLLPLGNKVIMEYNVDKIASAGVENLTVCIRYLGEKIQQYFGNGEERGLRIRYITEDKPLGTLGAATRIEHFEHDIVLVMNSDLFTDVDLEEFYQHFVQSGADMSVAATPYNISVPYAVMKTNDDFVTSFEEKPTYTYYSNAGIYLIKRSLLESLPKNERCDTTELMEQLLQNGGKLTYFPIIGYWMDIGTPEEYHKAKEIMRFIHSQQ